MTAPTLPSGAPTPTGPLARYLLHPGPETAHVVHHVGHVFGALAATVGPPVVGVALAVVVLVALCRHRGRVRMARGARLVTVLASPEVEPAGAATLWTNLVALLRPAPQRLCFGQPHLGFELTASAHGVTFALWVPGGVPPGLVEHAVEAAWPGARTETTDALPPLLGPGVATGGQLRLAAPEHYPLATDHPVDPLRSLLGALSVLGEHDAACVQVLARPVAGRRLRACNRAAAHRRSGRPTSRMARLADLVTPGPPAKAAAVDPTRAGDVAAILGKAAEPGWAVVVRYAVATEDAGAGVRARLRGQAHAVASAFAIFSGRNRLARHRLHHPARVLAERRLGRGDLVSVTELAALAHLPTDVTVPGLVRAGAKSVAPVPAVVQPSGPAAAKVLGDAEAGGHRPVALSVPDARHHLHVMGATGAGKSTLLANLALQDVAAGRGLVVVDPKGDLVTDLLDRLPERAAGRAVVIDPEERDAPPVMNVLGGGDADLAVDNLVGIFRSIFAAFWGPRTDDVLRAACLTLLRTATNDRPVSLADVPRLLADDAFRAPLTAQVMGDTVGLGGFWRAYDAMSEATRSQVIGPVMNKLRAFLLRDFVRQVVGRPRSSFDMGDVLDGGVCLVRVPKGVLGDDTAKLLGSFVVAKVWQAATYRARLGQRARVDATLLIDEAHNFLHLPRSLEEVLPEARGYGLSVVLAHQHLAQLPPELRQAVSSNARTKVWFSMSPEDAHALSRHVTPELTEHDLAHLGAFQAAARLVAGGQEAPACTLRTRPLTTAVAGRAEAVRAASRATFGRPAERPRDVLAVADGPEEMAAVERP